jgi:molybdate transport system permease protein
VTPAAWVALGLSLRVAVVATVAAVVVGVPAARLLAGRRGWWADVVSTVVLLPMVLPPTVLGWGLLVAVGRGSAVGRAWEAVTGGGLVFTLYAATLAAFVAALPFVVRTAQAAFEAVDPALEDAARTLGCGEAAVLWRVSIPLAWRGLVAGAALGFARAVGEFGATVMVAGNLPGRTQTASLAVYDAVQAGRLGEAAALAGVLAAATGAVLLAVTRWGRA